MDPQATLLLIYASTDADEAAEHCENLATWLRRGGFAPTIPADEGRWPGTNTDYAILCPHDDTDNAWLFARYVCGERAEWWALPSLATSHGRGCTL